MKEQLEDDDQFIFDDSSENIRIRQAILDKFVTSNRKITKRKDIKFGPLTQEYILARW